MENKEQLTKDFLLSLKNLENEEAKKMLKAIKEARYEWEFAVSYFNSVNDPELLEYAIYNQTAAEKKYAYLIKKAKELNIISN